jgi:GAF domain-containing protein
MSPASSLPEPFNTALVRLGRLALEPAGLSELLDRATVIIAETLGVDFCKILELLPDGENFVLRAGVGWQDGLVGQAVVPATSDTHGGYTLLTGEPVIVKDLQAEVRFPEPSLLHSHGVTSGMSVVIPGAEPFGVLPVHTSERRDFSAAELQFLGAAADILGRAIQRHRTYEAVRHSEEQFRRTFEDSPIGMTIGGLDHRFVRATRKMCEL